MINGETNHPAAYIRRNPDAIRNAVYQQGIETAEKILRVSELVLSGVSESTACKREGIDKNRFRRFQRTDFLPREEKSEKVLITSDKWESWQDKFLKILNGEETTAPEGFDEIYQRVTEKALKPREREIMQYRFQDGLSLEETARYFNVGKERTRQIEAKAIRKLRVPRYRLLLTYGPEYESVIESVNTAQAAYDKAYLTRMKEMEAERQKAIRDQKALGESIRERIRKLHEAPGNSEILYDQVPIDDLELSVRTYNALKWHRRRMPDGGWKRMESIDTIGKLSRMSKDDLRHIVNLGKKSQDEILYKLKEKFGIELPEDEEDREFREAQKATILGKDADENACTNEDNPEPSKPDINSIPLEDLGLSVRSYNCLKRHACRNYRGPGIPSFYLSDLAGMTKTELSTVRNLGRKCQEEIIHMLENDYGIILRDA